MRREDEHQVCSFLQYLELYTSVKFIYFGHYDVRPENKMKVFE